MAADTSINQSKEPGSLAPPDQSVVTIADERFILQLDQIRKLKRFLFEEKVNFKQDDLDRIDLGELNNLTYARGGRRPENREWRLLDEKLSALTSYLGDDLRPKLRIRELDFFFAYLPVVFLTATAVSTAVALLLPFFIPTTTWVYGVIFVLNIIPWAMLQGGLGACAFLVTSALARGSEQASRPETSQRREFIDVTDSNFLKIRILSGVLFGFLLGLPFAAQALQTLNRALTGPILEGSNLSLESSTSLVQTLSATILPFVVGFSTNIVLIILTRFLSAVESLFGK